MRRFWPVALIAVGLGLVLLLTPDRPVLRSGLWAVDAATTQVIILWPVIVGLAAADAVRLRRTGALDLLASAPVASRVRLLVGRSLGLAAWASIGVVVCVVLGVVLARVHGSPVPWRQSAAWFPLVLAVCGLVAAAVLGTALACLPVLRRSWSLPPLAAALTYALLIFDHGIAPGLLAFTGATGTSVVVLDFVPAAVGWQLGLFVVVIALMTVLVAVATGAGRAARVCLVVLVVMLVPVEQQRSAAVTSGMFALADVSMWPCEQVSARSQACLPRDQQHSLSGLAESMRPLDTRLRELAPETGAVRYGPVSAASEPLRGWLDVRAPISSDEGGGLATDLATGLSGCSVPDEAPEWSEADHAAYVRALVAVTRYLDPEFDVGPLTLTWSWSGDGRPLDLRPTLAEAQAALVDLRTCRGFW